jgi:hypothetical protein
MGSVAPKRRQWCTAAIFGHRSGPAVLGLRGLSPFFLLDWRIFLDLDVAISAAASPSGLVPSGSKGGRACRSSTVDGEAGLNRVCAIFFGCVLYKS